MRQQTIQPLSAVNVRLYSSKHGMLQSTTYVCVENHRLLSSEFSALSIILHDSSICCGSKTTCTTYQVYNESGFFGAVWLRVCLSYNAVVGVILPAGAIYADESDIYIDGKTSFRHNSAKGEPRSWRGVE